MTLLRDRGVAMFLALLISAVGTIQINLEITEVWTAWLEPCRTSACRLHRRSSNAGPHNVNYDENRELPLRWR